MNPLIQLNRQPQYWFIALLLTCFAIAQTGQAADNTPNHREIVIKPLGIPLGFIPCAAEKVALSGKVKISFHRREDRGGLVFPVDIKLVGFSGIGETTGRKYVAGRVENPGGMKADDLNGLGVGTFKLRFLVTGNPNPPSQGDPNPGNVVSFKLLYTVSYKFSNNKVTFFKATPDICCPKSSCFSSRG
jgi:hypothetical protein